MDHIAQTIEELEWTLIRDYCLKRFNIIEFNILYEGGEYYSFKTKFRTSFIKRYSNPLKLNYIGDVETVRFRLTDDLKRYLSQMKFKDFLNKPIEDISFYMDEKEIISTITHEKLILFKVQNLKMEDVSFFKDIFPEMLKG